MRGSFSTLVLGIGLGAAAMFGFDPSSGRRRRELARDRVATGLTAIAELASAAERELQGAAALGAGDGPASPSTALTATPGETALAATGPFAAGRPARRLLEGGAGSLLALVGLVRGGLVGRGVAIGGAYLVSRAADAGDDARS